MNLSMRGRVLGQTSTTKLLFRRLFSTNSTCFKSHYEVLGVPTSASKKDIKDGYIRNSKLYHPDNDPSDPTLHEKFLAVQEAYDVLSNDIKRKEYDVGKFFHRSTTTSHHHQRHQHQQSAEWSEPKEKEKNRAFWTDPEYQRMKPNSRKTRIFGREFDSKETNRLVVIGAFIWMTLGTVFVYVYVKYVFGQNELIAIERQKRISRQYQAVRDEALSSTREEALEKLQSRLKERKIGKKNDGDDP